jgi:hypothetical protein
MHMFLKITYNKKSVIFIKPFLMSICEEIFLNTFREGIILITH